MQPDEQADIRRADTMAIRDEPLVWNESK